MPDVLTWWRKRPAKTKARLVFYPGLALSLAGAVLFMTVMPGTSPRGPLRPLGDEEKALAADLRADVTALVAFGDRSTQKPEALARSAAWLEATLPRSRRTSS
jgi:hypothetical protein